VVGSMRWFESRLDLRKQPATMPPMIRLNGTGVTSLDSTFESRLDLRRQRATMPPMFRRLEILLLLLAAVAGGLRDES